MKKANLAINKGRHIPHADIDIQYVRSSGPGGQNVNKVATKVHIRVHLSAMAKVLSEYEMKLIKKNLKNRINQEDYLYLECGQTRHQKRNLDIALSRMQKIIRQALVRPKPRKKTKPTRASQQRRLNQKKQTAEKKDLRKPIRVEK